MHLQKFKSVQNMRKLVTIRYAW